MSQKYLKKNLVKYIGFIFFCFLFSCFTHVVYAQGNTYSTEYRLFHIERSKNKNLVCYDVNLTGDKLNTKEPLQIYWVNREEEPGKKSKLNQIQRKLAYGYKVISSEDNVCIITLSAYSERKLTIRKSGEKYICTLLINNQTAILQSLYVKAKENNSLSVEYVELRGISLYTGNQLTERVKNK